MTSPYIPPEATLQATPDSNETYAPRLFSLHGRIGRMRYICYTMLTQCMLLAAFAVVAVPLVYFKQFWFLISVGLLYLAMSTAISFVYLVRRLHDLDKTGWMSLLMLVPLVNLFFGLYLLFAAGSPGRNQFGLLPAPNSRALMVLFWGALALNLLMSVGSFFALPYLIEKFSPPAEEISPTDAPSASEDPLPDDDADAASDDAANDAPATEGEGRDGPAPTEAKPEASAQSAPAASAAEDRRPPPKEL